MDRDVVGKYVSTLQGVVPHTGEVLTIIANSVFLTRVSGWTCLIGTIGTIANTAQPQAAPAIGLVTRAAESLDDFHKRQSHIQLTGVI